MACEAIDMIGAAYLEKLQAIEKSNNELKSDKTRLEAENIRLEAELKKTFKLVELCEKKVEKLERREAKLKDSRKKYCKRYEEANHTIVGLKHQNSKFYLCFIFFYFSGKLKKQLEIKDKGFTDFSSSEEDEEEEKEEEINNIVGKSPEKKDDDDDESSPPSTEKG